MIAYLPKKEYSKSYVLLFSSYQWGNWGSEKLRDLRITGRQQNQIYTGPDFKTEPSLPHWTNPIRRLLLRGETGTLANQNFDVRCKIYLELNMITHAFSYHFLKY